MSKPLLSLKNIHTFYGNIEALKGVSIEVNEGEIVTIIGANGAGKSTLMNTICANPAPKIGEVFFDSQRLSDMQTHEICQTGIALVPEGRRIFARLSVAENLELGGFFHSKADNNDNLQRIYDLFPRLKERRKQRAGTLSGGEQQMLAIGRGLMMQPRLLMLDEPSLGLAPIIIQQIFDIIQDIRSQGITVLFVEQNANKALEIADRGYVLEIGNITHQDTGKNLLNSDAIRSAYLGV